MIDYDDYKITYSELMDNNFDGSYSEWLKYLSPKAIEAYDEYIEDTGDKENY